jgi:adenine-specific DNA-methyltransferase
MAKTRTDGEKDTKGAARGVPVDVGVPTLADDRVAALRSIMPEVFGEAGVDFEKLKLVLGGAVEDGKERYGLSWSGKAQSVRQLMLPARGTLVPDRKESVNFDGTQHVFIEGENLEVLKLLRKAYAGRVKMIYIDPPYNTGKDFIYPDNYGDPLGDYLKKTGQVDEEGNWTSSVTESDGRKHSKWLSMIYPRLLAAKDLLRDDGVIFVSIDDHEVHNLRMVMNEVFGEENFVACFVWAAGRKNDSRLVSESHEYMLCFVRSSEYHREHKTEWRQRKQGLDDIYAAFERIKKKHGTDFAAATEALKEWYSLLPKGHPAKQHDHYSHVDKRGIYFPDNISWPGGGGPSYKVLHPRTKKPCSVPSRGWMFATPERMAEAIADDRVHFGADETAVPCIKSHLKDREYQVPYSVFYQDGRAATKRLRTLIDGDYFEHPKDEEVLQGLVEFATGKDDLIVDFFAGSGTTAHAAWLQSVADLQQRRFLLVQLPEETPEGSAARGSGFETIAQLTRKRLMLAGMDAKRALKDVQATPLTDQREKPSDFGFRAFRLTESHYKRWLSVAQEDPPNPEKTAKKYIETMALYTDPLLPGWTAEGLLWEVALKAGYPLHATVETVDAIKAPAATGSKHTVYRVRDPDRGTSFHACFDKTVTADLAAALKLTRDDVLVVRDAALTDTAAANLALTCVLRTI